MKFKVNEDRRAQGACKIGCTWRIWVFEVYASKRLQVNLTCQSIHIVATNLSDIAITFFKQNIILNNSR